MMRKCFEEVTESLQIEIEGRESIDACLIPAMAKNLMLDEGRKHSFVKILWT